MKQKLTLPFIAFVILYLNLYSDCNWRRSPNNCATTTKDTIQMPIASFNSNVPLQIFDTVYFETKTNDTCRPNTQPSFIYSLSELYSNFSIYKIDRSSMLPQLSYANIEFNFVVKDGRNINTPLNAYQVLNRRLQPYNFMKVGFVAGRRGLFVIVANPKQYSNYGNGDFNIFNSSDLCTNYKAFNLFTTSQNKNYWDTLNVSDLRLGNTFGGTPLINKSDKNYVFIKVN